MRERMLLAPSDARFAFRLLHPRVATLKIAQCAAEIIEDTYLLWDYRRKARTHIAACLPPPLMRIRTYLSLFRYFHIFFFFPWHMSAWFAYFAYLDARERDSDDIIAELLDPVGRID